MEQLGRPNPHGLFRLEAAALVPRDHPCVKNSVGVDPGIRNLGATSTDVKITRKEYGHAGRVLDRAPFDPATCGAGFLVSKSSGTKHSRRSRLNMIPAAIVAAETQLAQKALSACGQDCRMFGENLVTFIQRAGELRAYYGWRNIRFTRASKTREKVAKVVDLIAPAGPEGTPPPVVVFGTGFTGRSQSKGDQTGAIAVSSIRAALAARRLVVLVDEYNTTACHLECGNKMEKAKHDEHEKFCPVCQMDVDRDLNAGKNIHAVWTSQVTTGCRPAHLRRP